MKKEYIKPEVIVEEVLLEGMILAISGPHVDGDPDSPFGGEGDANHRRGTWGNLWAEQL